MGWGPFTGNSDSWWALETEHLPLWALCEENPEGGFPLLGTLKVMNKKALVTGISFHRGPNWETGRRFIYHGL